MAAMLERLRRLLLCIPLFVAMATLSCEGPEDIRGSNERAALGTLMTLRHAEDDLYKNDKDKNGIKDYWTGDIAGLYALGLIPREIAEADASPIKPLIDRPKPYHGYLFVALEWDDDAGESPDPFKQDTDGKSGKVHHRGKFGWCAYPRSYGETSRNTYICSIGGAWGGPLKRDTQGAPVLRWPRSKERRTQWSTFE